MLEPQPRPRQPEGLTLVRAQRLVGKPVLDPYGEEIGTIASVGATDDDQPVFVVEYGGVFGLFEDRAYLTSARVVTAYDDQLVVDVTEDGLDGLPRAE